MPTDAAQPYEPRGLLQRFYESVYFLPAVALPAGVVVAVVAAGIDNTVLLDLGIYPRFSTVNVRALFSAVAGATITVTAVLFWVRGTLVQLASTHLSDQVLRWYLEDRFLQGAIALLLGIFSYMAVSLLTLPSDPDLPAPFMSALLGLTLALVALLTVVVTIANSVASTQVAKVLDQITRQAVKVVNRRLPEAGKGRAADQAQACPEEEVWPVHAEEGGWVRVIDERALLDVLPAGSGLWLDVRVGGFVATGSRMARVSATAGGNREHVEREVHRAIRLGSMRSREQDVTFGLRQLVDVGLAAVSPGTGDTATAFEVIFRIGEVMRAVLVRDLPIVEVSRDAGGTLYRSTAMSHADMVELAFDELRWAGASYPNVAMGVLATIGTLVEELQSRGLEDRSEPLRRQADLLLWSSLRADVPEEDRERVRQKAREYGLLSSHA